MIPRIGITIDESEQPYRKVTVQAVCDVVHPPGEDDMWRDLYRTITGRYTADWFVDEYVDGTDDQPRRSVRSTSTRRRRGCRRGACPSPARIVEASGRSGTSCPGRSGRVTISDSERTWLHALPKVELHVHLEGSMSVATVRELTERHGVDPTPVWPDGFPEAFSFDGFPSFAKQYFYGLSLLRSADDLATITDDLAATLAAQNVRYAEITTTAYTHFLDKHDRPGMSWGDYREGLDEGRRRAAARGVGIGWVVDIPRDLEMPHETVTIDFLESDQTPAGLVAIGLGGYEVGFPAAPYVDQFARAAAIGLPSVPHAGETEGADSIRQAVEALGAVRIGHGVRCLEDPAVVDLLVERRIMLEVCPTSNDLLQVVEHMEDHPLPALVDAGLRVCLNTDDPGWFATDLVSELVIATDVLGVSLEDHRRMQLDAISASFLPAASAMALATEVAAF